jgi:hypothetical protein
MTSHIVTLCFGAYDPHRLARFWAGVLDLRTADDGLMLPATGATGFGIQFQPSREPKAGPNQMHLHLAPPPDGDLRAEADRLVSLAATRIEVGAGSDPGRVAMADPDGNEFCVLTLR